MKGKVFSACLSAVAAVGSLLFGYDTAVISGTVDALRTHFALDPLRLGWVVGSALIGCIAGSVVAGELTDWLGRRKVLALSAALFLVSSAWCYYTRSENELVIARILGGIGVGFASLAVPVYIAELAPPGNRGALVQLNQIGILVGMVLSYFVNARIGRLGDEAWLASTGWRIMLGAEAIPAALFLGLLFAIPESPRWLLKKGRTGPAKAILERVHGPERAAAEFQEIARSLEQIQCGLKDLLHRGTRRTVVFAVVLAIFQAVTGINVVMYYAPTIFRAAGVATGTALNHSIVIGLVMLVFTTGSMFLVDRFGRRPIMLAGSGGMGAALTALGIFFARSDTAGTAMLLCILAYVAFFSIGMGGIFFVVVSEIFPTRIRGAAASLSVLSLWIGNYLVSLLFPAMLAALAGSVFYVYALLCLMCLVFVAIWLPETKGKTLEEIERELFSRSA
jgi:MFS transporter, SP family, arabinose:H+ symporter